MKDRELMLAATKAGGGNAATGGRTVEEAPFRLLWPPGQAQRPVTIPAATRLARRTDGEVDGQEATGGKPLERAPKITSFRSPKGRFTLAKESCGLLHGGREGCYNNYYYAPPPPPPPLEGAAETLSNRTQLGEEVVAEATSSIAPHPSNATNKSAVNFPRVRAPPTLGRAYQEAADRRPYKPWALMRSDEGARGIITKSKAFPPMSRATPATATKATKPTKATTATTITTGSDERERARIVREMPYWERGGGHRASPGRRRGCRQAPPPPLPGGVDSPGGGCPSAPAPALALAPATARQRQACGCCGNVVRPQHGHHHQAHPQVGVARRHCAGGPACLRRTARCGNPHRFSCGAQRPVQGHH